MLITAAFLYTEAAEYWFFSCNLTGLTVRTTYQRTYKNKPDFVQRIVAKNYHEQQQH